MCVNQMQLHEKGGHNIRRLVLDLVHNCIWNYDWSIFTYAYS